MTNNLQQWLDEDGFETPLIKSTAHPAGRTYHVESPDYETGAKLQRIADLGAKVHAGGEVSDADRERLKLDDDQEVEFSRLVLGDLLDTLTGDGVKWDTIRKLVKYTFAFYTLGEDAAEKVAAPKALAPANREGRRKGKKKASSGAK